MNFSHYFSGSLMMPFFDPISLIGLNRYCLLKKEVFFFSLNTFCMKIGASKLTNCFVLFFSFSSFVISLHEGQIKKFDHRFDGS